MPMNLVEPDDVGVLQKLHDLHFPGHLASVFSIQASLVNDFDGNLCRDLSNRVVPGVDSFVSGKSVLIREVSSLQG